MGGGREETDGVLQESFTNGVKINWQSNAKIMKICALLPAVRSEDGGLKTAVGVNVLVGADKGKIIQCVGKMIEKEIDGNLAVYGRGDAGEKVVEILTSRYK